MALPEGLGESSERQMHVHSNSISSESSSSSYPSTAASSIGSATPPEPQRPGQKSLISSASSSSSSRRSLSSQYNDDSHRKQLRCAPCGLDFTTNRSLLRHRRESRKHHHNQPGALRGFQCSVCSQTFSRAHGRDRHYREQHGEGKIACPRCGKLIRRNAPHANASSQSCVPDRANARPRTNLELKAALETGITPVLDSYQSSGFGLEGPHHAIGKCEGLCFLKPMESAPRKMGSTCLGFGQVNESRRPFIQRSHLCGICRKDFEVSDNAALFAHLNGHLQDLERAPYRCNDCNIGFAHTADLTRHLRSAATGSCGYPFSHEEPCLGHHPGAEVALADAIREKESGQAYLSLARLSRDRDSLRFALKIRTWEHSQLGAYLRSTNLLQSVFKALSRSISA